MSAETLREATRLMRERADVWMGSTPRWDVEPTYSGNYGIVADSTIHGPIHVVDCDSTNIAAHIASMDPTVALAVADWLESVAGAQVSPDEDVLYAGRMIAHVDEDAALALANAYLRRDA